MMAEESIVTECNMIACLKNIFIVRLRKIGRKPVYYVMCVQYIM